jgi:hypothetical protein
MARTRHPACKTTVNWVTLNIRRTVWKRSLERWEKEKDLANRKATPQAIWPIAISLPTRGGPKAPPAFHGPLGPIFYPIKANIIADYLASSEHMTCVTYHR